MEKKMAKFIAFQLSDKQKINQDAFQKITSKDLKKTCRCKKVTELKYGQKSVSKLAEFAEISEYKLNQLSSILSSTDLDDISEMRYGSNEDTKIFILSDDASAKSVAFKDLKDKCIIKFFQLNDEQVTNFTHSIEIIQSAEDLIYSLDEAKELCESLKLIQDDVGLTLVYRNALDEIDEKNSDIESDVETSKETLEEIFDTQWN
jgi:hypothetical protein